MKRALPYFIAALALSACVNLNPNTMPLITESGPEPDRDQVDAQVRAILAATLKDPDSLKQYRLIGVYKTRWMRGSMNGGGSEEGWLACFEYNAKNSYGAYTGAKTDGLVFRSVGGNVRIVPGAAGQIMTVHC